MKVIKFSKSYKDISIIKSNFITDNEKYLLYAKKLIMFIKNKLKEDFVRIAI